jgi:Tfp pilus assembly protein PilF
MRFKILFTLLTIFIYSCASAQPQPDSGTKNKKAKDMLSRAVGEFKAGQFKMCLETVNDVLKKDDKYIDAWMLKGDVLAEMQLYDEAEKCFDAVFAINAEYLRAYLAKAKVQVQAQKYKEAKENLDKFMSFPYAEKFK